MPAPAIRIAVGQFNELTDEKLRFAAQLGISPRTIEVHRARIMAKLGAKNAADLMRIVLSKESRPPRSMAT